jgi:hypothetical protein
MIPSPAVLVAAEWLAVRVAGVPSGLRLPEDTSAWAATGFLRVEPMGGGSNDIEVRTRHSMVQVVAHTYSAGSVPPKIFAAALAERVLRATWPEYNPTTDLDIPRFERVRVFGARVMGDPVDRSPTTGAYAEAVLTLTLDWVGLAIGGS